MGVCAYPKETIPRDIRERPAGAWSLLLFSETKYSNLFISWLWQSGLLMTRMIICRYIE
jgi:hypothetical protein